MKQRFLAMAVCALTQVGCGAGGRSSASDSATAQTVDTVARDQTVRDTSTIAPAGSVRPESNRLPPADSARNSPVTRSDTAIGIVKLLGTAPTAQLALIPNGGGGNIALAGPIMAALKRANGAEIWVSGKITSGPGRPLAARRMEVERFVVRTVDGVRVTDGILMADGETLFLVASDGTRHRLVTPPSALRSQVGARVWIAGPIDQEPNTFGIIQPKS